MTPYSNDAGYIRAPENVERGKETQAQFSVRMRDKLDAIFSSDKKEYKSTKAERWEKKLTDLYILRHWRIIQETSRYPQYEITGPQKLDDSINPYYGTKINSSENKERFVGD